MTRHGGSSAKSIYMITHKTKKRGIIFTIAIFMVNRKSCVLYFQRQIKLECLATRKIEKGKYMYNIFKKWLES